MAGSGVRSAVANYWPSLTVESGPDGDGLPHVCPR